MVLLAVTFVVGDPHRGARPGHPQEGVVHLVLFAAFIFLAINP